MKQILFFFFLNIIATPTYGQGKKQNDYGRGVYCTENKELAKEWAVQKGKDGFANKYQLREDGLKILSLSDPQYCLLHWLAILLENRQFDISLPLARAGRDYLLQEFSVPYKKYDVIIGYRADDSYFSFAQDFLSGGISIRQLNEAMRLGKLGEQYMLRSKKAFAALESKGYEGAAHEKWYLRRQERDTKARQAYHDMEKNEWRAGDLFITHILEERIRAHDERLR